MGKHRVRFAPRAGLGAGKGDAPRNNNTDAFRSNYDRIFGQPEDLSVGSGCPIMVEAECRLSEALAEKLDREIMQHIGKELIPSEPSSKSSSTTSTPSGPSAS